MDRFLFLAAHPAATVRRRKGRSLHANARAAHHGFPACRIRRHEAGEGRGAFARFDVEAAIVKDVGTVWEQKLPHKARDLAAFVEEEVANRATFEQHLAFATLIAPKLTIQGGTTEILRGIIARGLGLR